MGQSKNVYQAKFTINGDEYENKPIFCIFEDSEGERKFMNLGYGTGEHCINIPSSVLIDDYFKIGLFAGDRLTTNIIKINLVSSLYQDDLEEAEEEADPHAITDIYQKLESKAKKCHTHEVSDIIDFPDIPTKTSELENDGDGENPFLTEHQDISGKANVADLADIAFSGDYDDLVDPPHIPTELSELENDMGYVTDATLEDYLEVSDVSAVALTGDYDDLTDKPSIPENTSDLYNDGDGEHPFLTEHQDISGKANISDLANVAFSGDYDDLEDKPFIATKTSQLLNDQEFATIYDVAQSVGNLQLVEIVEQLPTENIKPNRLYLVLAEGGSGTDQYDVYIRVNNQWEKIDSISIDISGKEDKSNKVTSLSAQSTNTEYPSAKAVYDELETKADTTDVPTAISDLTNDSDFIETSSTVGLVKNDGTIDTNTYLTQHQDISNKIDKSSTVGLVKNDGTIDTTQYLSQHQDISNKIDKSNTAGLVKNDGTIDTTQYVSDVSGKQDKSNLVTSISSSSTNTEYPSAKCVYDAIDAIDVGEEKDILTLEFTGDTFTSPNTDPFTYTGTITIDWGDGNTETYSSGALSHTYSESGTYKIVIDGNITALNSGTSTTGVFYNMTGLTKVHLPASIIDIGLYCFYYCSNLTSINTENIIYFGQQCLANCTNLTDIKISPNARSLGRYCFSYSGLKGDIKTASTTALNRGNFCGTKITSIDIPLTVSTIEQQIVAYCTELKEIKVPSSVTIIDKNGFEGCTNLKKIEIGENVALIYNNAFSGLTALNTLIFKPTTPPSVMNSNAFNNLPTTCKIYVPAESINAYKTASNYPDPNTYTYIPIANEVVDAVTDSDMKAVTSNAVYDAIDTAIGNIQSFINQ